MRQNRGGLHEFEGFEEAVAAVLQAREFGGVEYEATAFGGIGKIGRGIVDLVMAFGFGT